VKTLVIPARENKHSNDPYFGILKKVFGITPSLATAV